MRGKTKLFLLSSLLVLLVASLLGCGFLERLVNPPSLDRQQAVVIIVTAGVPFIDKYFAEAVGEEEAAAQGKIGPVTATGTWDASYQGDGKWEVYGPVTTKNWGECSTTWSIDEADSKIHLIEFNCD